MIKDHDITAFTADVPIEKPVSPAASASPVASSSGESTLTIELPDFTDAEINNLIPGVELYLREHSFTEFSQSNLFLMLIHALKTAINKSNHSAVQNICEILIRLNDANHQGFLSLLGKKIDVSPYTGQSFAFTIVDQFYSATITRDLPSLISLNFLFSKLLNADSLFLNQLTELQASGNSEGMFGLLLIVQSLLRSSTDLMSSELIANLVILTLKKNEDGIKERLLQPITHTAFSGQSLLTFLLNVIKIEAQNTNGFNSLLIKQLIEVIQSSTESLVYSGLMRVIKRGPDAGMNAVYIFLQSFIASVQIKSNTVVSDLLELFQIIRAHPDFSVMMLDNITTGKHTNQSGMSMLVQALMIAKDKEHDINPLIAIFEQIIAEQGQTKVLFALQQRLKYSSTTYFQLLTNLAKSDSSLTNLLNLLNKEEPKEKSDVVYSASSSFFSNTQTNVVYSAADSFFSKTQTDGSLSEEYKAFTPNPSLT